MTELVDENKLPVVEHIDKNKIAKNIKPIDVEVSDVVDDSRAKLLEGLTEIKRDSLHIVSEGKLSGYYEIPDRIDWVILNYEGDYQVIEDIINEDLADGKTVDFKVEQGSEISVYTIENITDNEYYDKVIMVFKNDEGAMDWKNIDIEKIYSKNWKFVKEKSFIIQKPE